MIYTNMIGAMQYSTKGVNNDYVLCVSGYLPLHITYSYLPKVLQLQLQLQWVYSTTSTCRHLRRGNVTVHLCSVTCSNIVLKYVCKCISTVPYKTDVTLHFKMVLQPTCIYTLQWSNPSIHRMAQVERV